MAEANPRWIDAPEFHWNPERPFAGGPFEPEPAFEPSFESSFEPSFAPLPENAPANDDAPAAEPEAAPVRKTHSYLTARLVIGAAQGLGLLFLFAGPTSLSSPLGLVLLFAPLMLLAGLGAMPGKLLLPWTVAASLGLALLGALRGTDDASVTLILLAGLFLFIGQAMIAAWGKSGAPLAPYPAYHDSAWTLTAQALLCALAAAVSVLVINAGMEVLRSIYPSAQTIFPVALLAPLSVALMSWAVGPHLAQARRLLRLLLILIFPPVLLLAAGTGVGGLLLDWQPPLLFCLIQAFALLICLNASYGDGTPRPRWRQVAEAASPFAMIALVLLGAAALGPRAALGWTPPRILAAAALALLAGYAVFYLAAALIGLGGGGWMKRMERANLGLALVALALLATLAFR